MTNEANRADSAKEPAPLPAPNRGKRRQFGTVTKSRKRWAARYEYLGATHSPGKTFPTRGMAEGWLNEEHRLIALGVWTTPESRRAKQAAETIQAELPALTFGEYANRWLTDHHQITGRPLAARTATEYRRYLDRGLIPAFGKIALTEVTTAKVLAWFKSLSATPVQNARWYDLLATIFRAAVTEHLLERTPCTLKGTKPVELPRNMALEPEQIFELADALADHGLARYRLTVLLAGWCGLRWGEIAELRRKDIDLDGKQILVTRAVTWPISSKTPIIGPPKTKAGVRRVAIPAAIIPDLQTHLDTFALWGMDGLIFPDSQGRSSHNTRLGTGWDLARQQLGLDGFHFHDLRGTAATLLAQQGATLAELMAFLGHATPTVAMRYQSATSPRLALLADSMNNAATSAMAGSNA